MSEWMRTKTQFRVEHLQCLADALAAVTPQWQGHIEVNPRGVTMRDYHRNALLAQIVVRNPVACGWGDLGFAAQPDGELFLVADDGHRNPMRGGVVTDAWLQRLTQEYAGRVVEKQADALDLDVEKTENADGSWRYELTRRGEMHGTPDIAERLW